MMDIRYERPALFEKTECNIWTDPYIQQQMLKAHLDPSSDAASRREESIQRITDFIMENTRPGTRLLDLGCGPGLYTSILSDNGYDVTGIDLNRVSIDFAAAGRKDINYIAGDYLAGYPKGNFDAVMMIYCDMGTHSDSDRDKLLQDIYRSLGRGGVFIFDVFTENLVQDKQESKNWEYMPAGGFWSGKEYLLLSQVFHYPGNRAFACQYHLLSDDGNKRFVVWDRYYAEEEITGILKEAGFSRVAIRRNLLEGNNFTSGNEMFIVAEK